MCVMGHTDSATSLVILASMCYVIIIKAEEDNLEIEDTELLRKGNIYKNSDICTINIVYKAHLLC